MDLVVAKFKENISWTSLFPNDNIVIYDKSDEENAFIKLPNIGREAHTYIHHIISTYQSLPEHTCFVQGDPTDKKLPLLQPDGWLNRSHTLLTTRTTDLDFEPLTKIFTCDGRGAPSEPGLPIEQTYRRFLAGPLPDLYHFPIGAQFIVSRKAITSRSLPFYKDMMQELMVSERLPWQLERIWPYIFTPTIRGNL